MIEESHFCLSFGGLDHAVGAVAGMGGINALTGFGFTSQQRNHDLFEP